MANRNHDTQIWDEDWFIDLPDHYKLLYLFIKDNCDYAGIWRINKRRFLTITGGGKLIMMDSFLASVNKDNDGEFYCRIIALDKHRWLIPTFILDQCGNIFREAVGAHKGMLKLLISNNVDIRLIPNFNWRGLQYLNNQELRELLLHKDFVSACRGVFNQFGTLIEKEKEIELESNRIYKDLIGNNTVIEDSSKSLNEEVNKEFVKDKTKFPTVDDIPDIPDIKVGAVIQLLQITQKQTVSEVQVKDMFTVFKLQNLNGEKFYNSHNEVYSHFINWIKQQKFDNNGKVKQFSGRNSKSERDIIEREELADRRTQALAKLGVHGDTSL